MGVLLTDEPTDSDLEFLSIRAEAASTTGHRDEHWYCEVGHHVFINVTDKREEMYPGATEETVRSIHAGDHPDCRSNPHRREEAA